MKTMKKGKHVILIGCLSILLTCIISIYVLLETGNITKKVISNNVISNNDVYINHDYILSDHEKFVIENLVKQYENQYYFDNIPNEFNNAFMYHTRYDINQRMNFYSLMTVESSDFKYFIGKNENGTYDYGPSQLNSENINNMKFIELYGISDDTYIESKYTEYMIISFNYYKDLLNKYGEEYIFFTYNGGPKAKRYIENNLEPESKFVKNIKRYDNNVRNAIDNNSYELLQYVSYNVSKDYILNFNGSPQELYQFNLISDKTNVTRSMIFDIMYDHKDILDKRVFVECDYGEENKIVFNDYINDSKISLKKDEDLIITLDEREIFKTIHIFIRDGLDIYFGTHYLYEFC